MTAGASPVASTSAAAAASTLPYQQQQQQNHHDSAYVNTEYTNRETLLCDAKLASAFVMSKQAMHQQAPLDSPSAVYLNTAAFQECFRHSVSSNGVVRKIPENLVLSNTPLPESQQSNSVQPSPALSTASGPYIPISECYSGSPKFMVSGKQLFQFLECNFTI